MRTFLLVTVAILGLVEIVSAIYTGRLRRRLADAASDLAVALGHVDQLQRVEGDLTDTRRALGDAVVDLCEWEAAYLTLAKVDAEKALTLEATDAALATANQNANYWQGRYDALTVDKDDTPELWALVGAGRVPRVDEQVNAALVGFTQQWRAMSVAEAAVYPVEPPVEGVLLDAEPDWTTQVDGMIDAVFPPEPPVIDGAEVLDAEQVRATQTALHHVPLADRALFDRVHQENLAAGGWDEKLRQRHAAEVEARRADEGRRLTAAQRRRAAKRERRNGGAA